MELLSVQRFINNNKWIRITLFSAAILVIFFLVFMFVILAYSYVKGPPPLSVAETTLFFDTKGDKIGESNPDQNRYWVSIEDISNSVIDATIATEDKRFYNHNGFDFKRIAAAILKDIRVMAKVEGASTISMQYARNLYLGHDKTWKRKIAEALYTLRLEIHYSKREILEGYLNTIYYGKGAHGIEAAAKIYFNKSAKDLTLAEAAILAGIPKAPSYYSPFEDLQKSKERQKIVLMAMVQNGYINETDLNKAYNSKLNFQQNIYQPINVAPYFIDAVKESLKEELKIDEHLIEQGGLRVYTTLDQHIQTIAEEKIENTIDKQSIIQTALVSMEPKTGKVRALIGGRNYKNSPFNRATQAERMPGSTFKPFLYYSALKNGFTPATTLLSEPTTFTYDDGRSSYRPNNYNNYYANDFITLAQALALSDNIFAVKTNMFLGPKELVATAKKFGISSPLKAVPSLALGTSTVKMMDMMKAYGMLANGGNEIKPVFIEKVIDKHGEVIYEHTKHNKQLLDPKLTFVTTHLMTGMFNSNLNGYTTVTGNTIINKLHRPYAGKSGTTASDSWMIGFSPQLVTGVWVGYDKDKDITLVQERQYAKNIWANVMEDAHAKLPIQDFKPPEGVVGKYIDASNGLLATSECPVKRLTYFIEGTQPTEHCDVHFGEASDKGLPEDKSQDKKWWNKLFDWMF